MKSFETRLLQQIKETVLSIDSDSEVFLFGSHARKEAKEDSDWDLLILSSARSSLKDEQRFRHRLFDLEVEFGVALSTFVYSKNDWHRDHSATPLYKNISREAVRI